MRSYFFKTPGWTVRQITEGTTTLIDGTNGNDAIVGTSGNDIIRLYKGRDTVNAGAGNDVILAADEDLEYRGDTGVAESDSGSINGGAGTDTLRLIAPGGPGTAQNAHLPLHLGNFNAQASSIEIVQGGVDGGPTSLLGRTGGDWSAGQNWNFAGATLDRISGANLYAGNDTVTAATTHTGFRTRYDGGSGNDTFRMEFTSAERSTLQSTPAGNGRSVWDVLVDYAANPTGKTLSFSGIGTGDLGFTAVNFEQGQIVVTDGPVVPTGFFRPYVQQAQSIFSPAANVWNGTRDNNGFGIGLPGTNDRPEDSNVIRSSGHGFDLVLAGAGDDTLVATDEDLNYRADANWLGINTGDHVDMGTGYDTLTLGNPGSARAALHVGNFNMDSLGRDDLSRGGIWGVEAIDGTANVQGIRSRIGGNWDASVSWDFRNVDLINLSGAGMGGGNDALYLGLSTDVMGRATRFDGGRGTDTLYLSSHAYTLNQAAIDSYLAGGSRGVLSLNLGSASSPERVSVTGFEAIRTDTSASIGLIGVASPSATVVDMV